MKGNTLTLRLATGSLWLTTMLRREPTEACCMVIMNFSSSRLKSLADGELEALDVVAEEAIGFYVFVQGSRIAEPQQA
jgi:hypothetical protein